MPALDVLSGEVDEGEGFVIEPTVEAMETGAIARAGSLLEGASEGLEKGSSKWGYLVSRLSSWQEELGHDGELSLDA